MINRQDIVWRLGLAIPLVLGSQFTFPSGRAAEDDWDVVTLAPDGT
jgi:hypothetical protein